MLGVDAERDNAPETHVILVAVCRHQSIRQRSLPDACVNRSHMSESNTPGTGQSPLVPGRDEMLRVHERSLLISLATPNNDKHARSQHRTNITPGGAISHVTLTEN